MHSTSSWSNNNNRYVGIVVKWKCVRYICFSLCVLFFRKCHGLSTYYILYWGLGAGDTHHQQNISPGGWGIYWKQLNTDNAKWQWICNPIWQASLLDLGHILGSEQLSIYRHFDRKFASEEESLLGEFDDELSDDWTEVTSRNHFFKSEKQIWERLIAPWLNLWIINFM